MNVHENNLARNANTKNSVRNKSKASASERKPAFKAVLETPYQLNWPCPPTSISNGVLKDITGSFTDFKAKFPSESIAKGISPEERRKLRSDKKVENKSTPPLTPPSTLIGINSVTRDIEAGSTSTSRVVLACKSDVNPSRLLAHLPIQIAVNNSKNSHSIVLIELPKGSEEAMAITLKLKRVAVVSLTEQHPLTATILRRLDDIQKYTLTAPWLNGDQLVYIPTKINHLETSIPRDMRKAKEERKKVQAAKKERINAYKHHQSLKLKS
ncbi:hypothetical protein E3P89_00562 [Wallemia ichthyophaga]|uniref:Uncharacterized protein n=1 Tax=Wallemia ichthyophaga TaxID=245174 RepID=A0A4T0IBL2_WALIC|nr:hypothetical protein E3P90_00721 [Wallemia ichthyophaga]TIB17733.1 hypothetical protein E3P93_00578 [Wallemia ichthyophaga]TIB25195.1 hypothetical protein E3P89_00562 [Wallemia ichthyophaga]TIB26900.1 hypothetical protein E3P88_00590 [Wallemia ichthyophaga]